MGFHFLMGLLCGFHQVHLIAVVNMGYAAQCFNIVVFGEQMSPELRC